MKNKTIRDEKTDVDHDENRDPITGAPGAHPVGSGVGAAGGAAAGGAIGAVGGPVGIVAGAIVGGLVGGLAGKGVAEKIDPTVEHEHWRNQYPDRDYASSDHAYEDYAPAYQYGWESSARELDQNAKQPRSFDEVEADLGREWDSHRADEDLTWEEARPAARDAYHRTHKNLAQVK